MVASLFPCLQPHCLQIDTKKSLQIPYTYGKLAFGVYAMAAVAIVGLNKRKRRSAVFPPFANSHSPLAHFLIADLPIRNRRNLCALNKNPVSNRQKNGIFLRFPCPPRLALPSRSG